MMLTRKDLVATVMTALAIAVYATTHEGWNVWLIGGSHRWATGAILLLGAVVCAQGSKVEGPTLMLFVVLGTGAAILAVVAFWTASLTPLSLLVLIIVLMWMLSTARHVAPVSRRPLTH